MNDIETARRFFLHSPADVAQSYVQWAQKLQEEPGITYGCILDKHIIPLHPGDMMAVVARPGHGKSSWMAYMARKAARDIIRRGADDEVVVYVSWEQQVEEIEAFFQSGHGYSSTDMAWGRVPMGTIIAGEIKRASLPIWMIGNSARHAHVKKPRMYADIIYEAIQALYYDYGKRPVLLLFDYIQIMPVTGNKAKMDEVSAAAYQAKELFTSTGTPGIVGVQASRGVDQYADQIPKMSDAQWSSAIEQTADKQLGLWRPSRTHDPEKTPVISLNNRQYTNDENLFVIRLLKQRFDAGFGTWAVHFCPQTLELHDYETRAVNL